MTPIIPYHYTYTWLELILAIEFFVLGLIVGYIVISAVNASLYPSPEVIYYFQNCNNLTLFPDGCQVLS
jgi:hypothetical protein